MTFEELVLQATEQRYGPYAYQRRIAHEGYPELLEVPTGSGKTLAATLPWLWRRRFHPDPAVRTATPHWLVYVLPMRVLVEQTHALVTSWLEELGLTAEVGLHLVMGGEGRRESRWRREPERDAIFVGTLDMFLSRSLNRGYGESRWSWPIDFGLFNNGCHFVYDEVQLMGPALPTSRQLDGLRRSLGEALPCSSTWMSATVDERQLLTPDRPSVETRLSLADEDRHGPLSVRLEATKTVRQLEVDPDPKRYVRSVAAALAGHHRAGTLSVAVMNTVQRAVGLHAALAAAVGGGGVELELVHARFRPLDRVARVNAALAPVDTSGPGQMVVTTQVLEAGVDVSATTLFTEGAPWPSVVQRAGRCNRDGLASDAQLLWASPPTDLPYEEADVAAAAQALERLEGETVTPPALGALAVATTAPLHPVLRRRDVLGLFDTTSDLAGDDIDVSRFIRASDDIDAAVAWRSLDGAPPAPGMPLPGRDERCPVPLRELRAYVEDRTAWRFDHTDEEWRRCRARDVRPGEVVVLEASEGGYDPRLGWSPSTRSEVPPAGSDTADPLTAEDTGVGSDPITYEGKRWLSLLRHLTEVEAAVRDLSARLAPSGLTAEHLEAAAVAGRLHDIGKVHPSFQEMLARTAANSVEEADARAEPAPWAKSGGTKRAGNARRYFRHELASALALLDTGRVTLDGVAEADLVVYLVAAHHGRVRLGFRSLPDEGRPVDDERLVALGVWDGDSLDAVDVPGVRLLPARLDLSVMAIGRGADGQSSWTGRALALRDRADLGPFRLGFLEALVRLADWRASAASEVGDAQSPISKAP